MRLEVKTAKPYTVTIESGTLAGVGEIAAGLRKKGAKAMLISETNVFPLYGEAVKRSLSEAGFAACEYVFEAGEESKQISTVCDMYRALAEQGFTRSDFIVTLGGGVAGDMGGFAAATYLRGISFLQVPTSLLAQVDASVGGKTGVDLPFGKNLVGAFHQPMAVVSDPDVLKTLSPHFFNDGMGEVIKYGCIADESLFALLERSEAQARLEEIITRCIACKIELVEQDAGDTGRRMILNFGHTFGHALEKLHGFRDLAHGEAVGIGMGIAARIGEKMGVTPSGTAERIEKLLRQYGLPTEHGFSKEELLNATALDKKSDGELLNLILLPKLGDSMVYPIRREELIKFM